jgi:hypothetical protein
LNQNVPEEEFEGAMQPAAEHHGRDARLQDGIRDPERVIKKSNLFAHSLSAELRTPTRNHQNAQTVASTDSEAVQKR